MNFSPSFSLPLHTENVGLVQFLSCKFKYEIITIQV